MVYFVATVALLALARLPAVLAHARITSNPPIRSPGPAFKAACGQTSFNSVSNDPTGHIEEQEPVNAGCELTLCRGMLFADQPASNVQTVKPLEAMEMSVDCTVPHGGPANVSIVDTTVGGAGKIIGSFLKTFDDFCPTTGPTPADQANLRYNLPDVQTIGTNCQNPGDCVVQLFWATPDFSQNYYYCVDVVMEAAQATTSLVVVPTTTNVPVVVPTPTASSAVIVPTTSADSPTTTSAIEPAATSPVAASPSPSKFVTSVVVVSAAAEPTGIAAAANAGPQTGAGRRRARILWF